MLKKFLAMQVAAQLTAAVIENLPDDMLSAADGKLPDDVKADNLLSWEVFRVFYHAVCGALDSPDWPEPKGTLLTLPGNLQDLLPVVGGFLTPDLVKLAGPLLKKLVEDLLPKADAPVQPSQPVPELKV